MKKLIFLSLIVASLFVYGCSEVHCSYPLTVKGIKINDNNKHHPEKYKVELVNIHEDDGDRLYMYTDTLFSVGEKIK